MNNPLGMMFQMMRGGGNPQQIIGQMMNNSQIAQNPMLKNAMEMASKGDSEGVEKLARNLCAEKGINPDEAVAKIKSQLGIN